MEDEATENNMQNANTIEDSTHLSLNVSPAVRRFIYLGCSVGPYRSQRYHIRGLAPLQLYSQEQVSPLDIFPTKLSKTGDRLVLQRDVRAAYGSPDIIDVIRKVLRENDGTSRRAALFILAACCRSDGELQQAAYAYVRGLRCSDDLLIFIKFAMDFNELRTGWGGGLRRALKSWYFDRDDFDLAEQLTSIRQRFCWAHKDVLKLLHGKPKNKVQEIIISYTMFGVGKAKQFLETMAKDDPKRQDAEKIMAYLEAADQLKRLTTPRGCNSVTVEVEKAVNLIKTHKFTYEHCDDTMHNEAMVWEALVENMPHWKLLEHLPKLRVKRILKPGEDLNKAIVNSLKHLNELLSKDSSSLTASISPGVVLVSMQTYRRVQNDDVPSKLWISTKDGVVVVRNPHGKVPSILTAALNVTKTDKIESTADANTTGMANMHIDKTRRIRELPKLNPRIVEMLNKIFIASVKAMKPTGKSYIFATGKTMLKNGCLVNPLVYTYEASSLLFICLDAVEEHESVAGYCIDSYSTSVVKLKSPGCSISTCSREITQETPSTPLDAGCWISYLSRQKMDTDVIVLVAESFVSDKDSGQRLLEAMQKYRSEINNPEAKLVVVSLDSKVLPKIEVEKFDYGILMVYGFDSQLPFIIQRFARGEF